VGFFDFLADTTRYRGSLNALNRLNMRHRFIVQPFEADLAGSRVLDLAAHDGRWSYALSAAGAREVVGVEARQELIDQFAEYPRNEASSKVMLKRGDVFEALPAFAAAGETFDVVAIYGLYYHIMDHYGLLKLVHALSPKLIIIDSLFLNRQQPLIRLQPERTDKFVNTIAHVAGQDVAPVGVPSRSAMDFMARSLGYSTEWANWDALPQEQRGGLKEYFNQDQLKSRDTVALRR